MELALKQMNRKSSKGANKTTILIKLRSRNSMNRKHKRRRKETREKETRKES